MSCLTVGKIQRQTTQRKGSGWKKKTLAPVIQPRVKRFENYSGRRKQFQNLWSLASPVARKKIALFICCKSITKWIQQLLELLKLPFHCEIKQLIEKYLDNFLISKILRSLGLNIFRRKVCICLQDEKSIY